MLSDGMVSITTNLSYCNTLQQYSIRKHDNSTTSATCSAVYMQYMQYSTNLAPGGRVQQLKDRRATCYTFKTSSAGEASLVDPIIPRQENQPNVQ